jgi:nitrite reductase/ring-hydroxylating ferredoxin subunit
VAPPKVSHLRLCTYYGGEGTMKTIIILELPQKDNRDYILLLSIVILSGKMASESSWVFAIEENKLQENSLNWFFPKGLPVLLIKKAGEIYAISNKCAHMSCPLGMGNLEDYTIKCPCHDWRYNIRTGEFVDAKSLPIPIAYYSVSPKEVKIPVYEWKTNDGKIFIKIEE